MKLREAGWCWEGQGLDPGVHPSVLGIGDGARYFGLKKARFLFHPTNDLALKRLRDLEVSVDITKWLHADTEGGGSRSMGETSLARVCQEADLVSLFSLTYPNISSAIHDDMLQLLEREGLGAGDYEQVLTSLHRHNPDLKLWTVCYTHELDKARWDGLAEMVDGVTLWVWSGAGDLDRETEACRAIFGDADISVGIYLRDYKHAVPQDMAVLERQLTQIASFLEEGRIQAFDILGAVLIDGQQDQARFVRQFIVDHS